MPVSGYGGGGDGPLTNAAIQALLNPLMTLGANLTVSGTAAGPGGQIQVTFTTAHGIAAGTTSNALLQAITGTTEANGLWSVSVVSPTAILLIGSVFVHAWVSGGTGNVITMTAGNLGGATTKMLQQLLDAVDRLPRKPPYQTTTLAQLFPPGAPNP